MVLIDRKVYERDCYGMDPVVAMEVLADLFSQPDITAAKKCGTACIQLNFKRVQYRIDNLPAEVAEKIPALVRKVREISQVPF
jgi:hypothetical protein